MGSDYRLVSDATTNPDKESETKSSRQEQEDKGPRHQARVLKKTDNTRGTVKSNLECNLCLDTDLSSLFDINILCATNSEKCIHTVTGHKQARNHSKE